MNELSVKLSNSGVGGTLINTLINHLMYADDICLIAISSAGLQKLLNMCNVFAEENDLIFNSKKTVCMNFSPKGWKFPNPCLYLNNEKLSFQPCTKYLGMFIENDSTNKDVTRQTRQFYAKSNMLVRNFKKCSRNVKCYLFRSYCSSMYGSNLWYNCTKSMLSKVRIAYNNSLRRVLNIAKYDSASAMFVNNDIVSFGEMLRKNIYRFINRLISCNVNSIISCIVNSPLVLESPLWKWWRSVLYV